MTLLAYVIGSSIMPTFPIWLFILSSDLHLNFLTGSTFSERHSAGSCTTTTIKGRRLHTGMVFSLGVLSL